MNLRVLAVFIFSSLFFIRSNAQKSSSIVDDSTKVIYGTSTTRIFTQETIYGEHRVFFNKDTLYSTPLPKRGLKLPLSYERPSLLSVSELKLKAQKDSLAKLKADSLLKTQNTRNDSVTYFKDDTAKNLSPLGRLFAPRKRKEKYSDRFFKNEYYFSRSDTLLDRIQHYSMNYVDNNIYQNLGVIGTPSQAVFIKQPETIGYNSGFTTFNQYYTEPSKVKYYNSKSPYTNVYYVGFPGTSGEDRIKLDINRNITRNWNVGLSYERISVEKQIGVTSNAVKGLALGQEFLVYTSTKSRNGRYHFMANFGYFLYYINEQGGLQKTNTKSAGTQDSILLQTELPSNVSAWPVNLNAPRPGGLVPADVYNKTFSRDRRVSYHVYHQFDILKLGRLSAFHEFDRRNQKYASGDPTTATDTVATAFYKGTNRVNDITRFNYEFAYIYNKIGLKTTLGHFTAIGYYKHRSVQASRELSIVSGINVFGYPREEFRKFFGTDPKSVIRLNEHYIGGALFYRIKDSVSLELRGEFIAAFQNNSVNQTVYEGPTTVGAFGTSGIIVNPSKIYTNKYDYNVNLKAQFYNLEVGLNATRATPPIINFYSLQHNLYSWHSELSPTITNSIYAKYQLRSKNSYFAIQPSVYQVENYNYFNSDIKPTQTPSGTKLFYGMMDLNFNIRLWKIHFDNYAKLTYIPENQRNDPKLDVIRMPTVFFNPRIYFKYVPNNKKFKQDFRFGFDIYYRSAYYGNAYMPSIGQYYVQNDFELKENVLVDLFITAKLRNARLFLKINQFNQAVGLTKGYYITPYYPGSLPSFVLGVHWMLFD